uniref:hypothetical protein n=1 Tax=Amycolatopsis sp. CA-290885 TaxID=3239925 RepID=UPI003F493324
MDALKHLNKVFDYVGRLDHRVEAGDSAEAAMADRRVEEAWRQWLDRAPPSPTPWWPGAWSLVLHPSFAGTERRVWRTRELAEAEVLQKNAEEPEHWRFRGAVPEWIPARGHVMFTEEFWREHSGDGPIVVP